MLDARFGLWGFKTEWVRALRFSLWLPLWKYLVWSARWWEVVSASSSAAGWSVVSGPVPLLPKPQNSTAAHPVLGLLLNIHPSSHPPLLHPLFRSSHPYAGSHFLVQAHSSLQLWGSPESAQGFSCCRPVLMTTLHPNVVSCGRAGTEKWCLRIGPMFLSLFFFILSSSPWDYE